MIFSQLTNLPIIFQVDEDIYTKVNGFLQRSKLSFHKILVVSGRSVSFSYASKIANQYGWDTYILNDNTFLEIEELKKKCINKGYDLIVAVGGGKILDSIKRVSYLININHLSLPTIISNDGLISPIAVIKNQIGKTESIPGMMPMGVIIDLTIIKNSPLNYIRAAAGDILSNLAATNDWVLAHNEGRDHINDIAFHLSRSAANSLVNFEKKELDFKPFLRQIIQGQVNSGIAMSLAGSSRPCSGSEHLLSHAIDFLNLSKNVLHGIQVASISLFILFLQDKLLKEYVSYATATKIPLLFTELLDSCNDEIIKGIFQKSKEMRPGRYTVLDTISEDVFVEKFYQYQGILKTLKETE
ncbi:iron-containing alcohol dehydrogenase [uncultured Aquimarina sp.]|uniref:iron-containing alcohol dehydrogenase n=1 Tax=uncultured Aquimarina sp. TaxID=575652 RepID=UPI002614EE1B|nr:iron-containing alcohol dehydrogenase [uncultured Aquimarina sp.]